LNIHFENINLSSRTGPNSFAFRLIENLSNMGHKIVSSYQESDITCIFIESHLDIPEEHPTVQRLDGIWFKPSEFISKNTRIKSDYKKANKVIWQSKFDHDMITHHWGSKEGKIICNGASIEQKQITNESIKMLRNQYDFIFVSSANWHPQKRLSKNIELFKIIRNRSGKKCALVIMGSNPDHIEKDSDIYYTGSISHDACLEVFVASDWMIHLAWLDHCPNTVVEALTQKCPIICTDSGGTSELVGNNGIVIKETTPYNFELADYDNPYHLSLDNFEVDKIKNTIKVNNDHVNIKKVSKEYERVFLSILEGK